MAYLFVIEPTRYSLRHPYMHVIDVRCEYKQLIGKARGGFSTQQPFSKILRYRSFAKRIEFYCIKHFSYCLFVQVFILGKFDDIVRFALFRNQK